jgi:hypothetical protein
MDKQFALPVSTPDMGAPASLADPGALYPLYAVATVRVNYIANIKQQSHGAMFERHEELKYERHPFAL